MLPNSQATISPTKIRFTATEAISQMLGPYGQLLNGSAHAVERGVFAHNLMGAFQSGINHGSVQVMRDQVARHGWQMPRSR